ncbi:hypothetical protein BpHYR1_013134 [Brachionus plicatilis]|uniref:Uncharacterized protein n=1 Tax=Brachionus plicatilis TaxID=10195 RepID=A0A3M7Q9J4_BRAPC|nr:hypothetical protein BpHYR1_013134 [Brachionus plicatilis]
MNRPTPEFSQLIRNLSQKVKLECFFFIELANFVKKGTEVVERLKAEVESKKQKKFEAEEKKRQKEDKKIRR